VLTFNELAEKVLASEKVDISTFQRQARVLQSLWRIEQGFDCGLHVHRDVSRPLGSRLAMPWAQTTLANFLTENIRAVVRHEVLDPRNSGGKLFGIPRIFNDLLSSQPLCFNLFAELRFDLELASRIVARLTDGRFSSVQAIDFEHSPSRSDRRYTADRSAFDVFLTCTTKAGARGFVGIEVKYHENLLGKAAAHRDRYDEVASAMQCFRAESAPRLRESPYQQIWRDHLLAGAVRQADKYDDGIFVMLYPRANEHCHVAATNYTTFLSDGSTFACWLLEDVLNLLIAGTASTWPQKVFDRYCDFAKIQRALHS
jgi:hypothetical protein